MIPHRHNEPPAAVFIPAESPLDRESVNAYLTYTSRRHYDLRHILRDWSAVMHLLANGAARVVMFPAGRYGNKRRAAENVDDTKELDLRARYRRGGSSVDRPATVRAMVFVLSVRLLPDAGICIEYCIKQSYSMDGIIKDDWQKAVDYLYTGRCDVIVVAGDETLDPDRTPRVEVVAHQNTQPTRPDVPTGRRRPGEEVHRTRTSRITQRDAGA